MTTATTSSSLRPNASSVGRENDGVPKKTIFQLAAFKGQALTFRRWDQQMRQPILLVTPRSLVSVSPQDPFLHERTPLDTLGYDLPESRCRLND